MKDKFLQGLSSVLHLGDKVLEVHKYSDLQEVYSLDSLDDWWGEYEGKYELNLYNDGSKYVLSLYKDGDYSESLNLPLEIQ